MTYSVGERDRRPWGRWEVVAVGPGHVVKRIRVEAGQRISLQRHRERSETWTVIAGRGIFVLGSRRHPVGPGDVMAVPRGMVHRIEAHPESAIEIVEVQLGSCRESDIERLEDDYHRN